MISRLHLWLRTLAALLLTGCVFNLKPPVIAPAIPAGTGDALERFKSGGSSLEHAVKSTHQCATILRLELLPVFAEMQANRKKLTSDSKTNALLIAKARVNIAAMSGAANQMLAEWLDSKRKTGSSEHSIQGRLNAVGVTESYNCLSLVNHTRQLIDMIEGYEKARVEKNLTYLSARNQRRFNELSREIEVEAQHMSQNLKEISELLGKL